MWYRVIACLPVIQAYLYTGSCEGGRVEVFYSKSSKTAEYIAAEMEKLAEGGMTYYVTDDDKWHEKLQAGEGSNLAPKNGAMTKVTQ